MMVLQEQIFGLTDLAVSPSKTGAAHTNSGSLRETP